MKTATLFLTSAMALAPLLSNATVRRVNNVPTLATTGDLCYVGLQAAISVCDEGDTIHLEPSDASYGDATIAIPIVIIGAGYKLGLSPANDSLQATTKASIVNLITIGSGADGTVLMGLHFSGSFGGLTIANVSDITVKRCFFDSSLGINFPNGGTGVADITIAENYIGGSINEENFANVITNVTIRNNFINGGISLVEADDQITNLVVIHNTFNYNGNSGLKNAEVAFNAFYQGSIFGTNNTVHDNISSTDLPAGTNNDEVNMGNVYDLSVGTDDSKWNILSASDYDEQTGDEPRGMYSGISPYRLSGIPNIPTIYTLQSTLNTMPGGSVEVTLSTRTNN